MNLEGLLSKDIAAVSHETRTKGAVIYESLVLKSD